MLTPKQYEAVGRLALAFNEIEYAFEVFTMHYLSAAEWDVSEILAHEGMFRQKARRFSAILKVMAKRYSTCEPLMQEIQKWIKRAEKLAEKRNQYIHALMVPDFRTNTIRLRIGGNDVPCDEAAIFNLALESSTLANRIMTDCSELLVMINEIRGLK